MTINCSRFLESKIINFSSLILKIEICSRDITTMCFLYVRIRVPERVGGTRHVSVAVATIVGGIVSAVFRYFRIGDFGAEGTGLGIDSSIGRVWCHNVILLIQFYVLCVMCYSSNVVLLQYSSVGYYRTNSADNKFENTLLLSVVVPHA